MAFKFSSLVALVATAATVRAAPASTAATCSDGTQVPNEVCCNFVPVCLLHTPLHHSRG